MSRLDNVTKKELNRVIVKLVTMDDKSPADAFCEAVKAFCAAGRVIELRGFGQFWQAVQKPRVARDIGRGIAISVGAKKKLRFHSTVKFNEDCPL